MSQSKPALSVIVPVYNAEQYIKECVSSILQQDYPGLEIILVNDGSSDKSGALCDLLAEEHECVRVLHVENGGITKARLTGTRASKGSWITFVDADDWIGVNAYKDLPLDNDCDVVVTGICRYFNTQRQIMETPYLKEGVYDRAEIMNKIVPVMLWNPIQKTWALDPSLCTKIFKRKPILDWLEKAAEVGSDYGEDTMVVFPMMLQAGRIRITEKIYYYHRQRAAGVIPPYIKDGEFISRLHRVYEYLKKHFKEAGFWDIMCPQLDCFYINAIELKKRCYGYPLLEFSAYFPSDRIPPDSSVVLYGAGNLGRKYWEQNSLYHFCKIVSWVDTKYKECRTHITGIENPETIKGLAYDYVLVAVDDYYTAKDIALYLHKLGVRKEQIVWQSTRVNRQGFEEDFTGGEAVT